MNFSPIFSTINLVCKLLTATSDFCFFWTNKNFSEKSFISNSSSTMHNLINFFIIPIQTSKNCLSFNVCWIWLSMLFFSSSSGSSSLFLKYFIISLKYIKLFLFAWSKYAKMLFISFSAISISYSLIKVLNSSKKTNPNLNLSIISSFGI